MLLFRGTLFYFLHRMKYFSIEECTRSNTAAVHGVSNLPTDEHRQHLVEMIEELLDPLREAWGVVCEEESLGDPALRVSSGYRSDALNKLVGGSSTSAHSVGYAVDLIPANSDILRFRSFCASWLPTRAFDQLISEDENSAGVPSWIHIGYKNRQGQQRGQLLRMRGGKYLPW